MFQDITNVQESRLNQKTKRKVVASSASQVLSPAPSKLKRFRRSAVSSTFNSLSKTFLQGDPQECLTFLNEQWHTIDVSKLDAPSKNALLFFCAKFDLDTIMIDLIIESKIDLDVSHTMNYNFFGSTSRKASPQMVAYFNDSWKVLQILREHTGMEIDDDEYETIHALWSEKMESGSGNDITNNNN